MTTLQLTPAQHAILAKAINTNGGKIDWFPDHIKGGARKKVLEGMFNRALITPDGQDSNGWRVCAEGYDALGVKRPQVTLPISKADTELDHAVAAAESTWAQVPVLAKPRTRDNTKQADVIRMLQRPEGATISQVCAATGWQAHTVRGTFAGAFKKSWA